MTTTDIKPIALRDHEARLLLAEGRVTLVRAWLWLGDARRVDQ